MSDSVAAFDASEKVTPEQAVAASELAHALDEAGWARLRFRQRTRIIGAHGEDYEQRWPRVQQIVDAHNQRVIDQARRKAIASGWTPAELTARRLDSPQ